MSIYRTNLCQITENTTLFKSNNRINSCQITEKHQSKSPNIKNFKYLCGSK